MDKQKLTKLFSPDAVSRLSEVEIYQNIDSTNSEALRRLKGGQVGGFLIAARSQSAGRGRRGRNWVSQLDAGLYMSLVLPFAETVENLQALSLVAAIAVHDGIGSSYPAPLQLKWPNDILAGNRKLAGILLERSKTETGSAIVFGIGVNIKLPASAQKEIDRPHTDMSSIADREIEFEVLCASVVNHLIRCVDRFCQVGFAEFKDSWNIRDRYIGEDIVIEMGNEQRFGKSHGVNDDGCLVMQSPEGIKVISNGEIFPSLRPLQQD